MNDSTDDDTMQLLNDAAASSDPDIAGCARQGLQTLRAHYGPTIGTAQSMPTRSAAMVCNNEPLRADRTPR
ncbi:hypothetical protein SAMN04488068_2118 [Hydrocarboniphaga daqingensis]|uniref:Uncharacterized protein n=1 Tax=Hydrocarboniphaga daqingensis TaxID=490188 RepID=A0A1M5PA29_9GAMM|nr:hypothetical protein [Hydrocarboniphaga daqingensis]SHG98684.1 hypothetical protein SAMN04488068_2118 [Hydrocarboniphaga daqingensis]